MPEIIRRFRRILPEAAVDLIADPSYVKKVFDLFHRTDQKLSYLEQLTGSDFRYYFLRPSGPDKLLSEFDAGIISTVLRSIMSCEKWDTDSLKKLAVDNGIGYGAMFRIIRLALIDSRNGPPVPELFQFFGKSECCRRFSELCGMLKVSEMSSPV